MDGAAGSVAPQRLGHAALKVDVGSPAERVTADHQASPRGEAPSANPRTLKADPGPPPTSPPTESINPGMPPARPADGIGSSAVCFGDRVASSVAARSSQLVLGLDPDPARLWPRAVELADRAPGDRSTPARAARAVAAHCSLAIEATAAHCVAVKLQVACFERLGAPGWSALREVAERARARGLLVIADAKRGDIDVTAKAYAQAFFGETADRVRPRRWARRRRADGQPAARDRLARAVHRRSARVAAAVCSCSCGPRIRGPPISRISSWSPAGPSATTSPAIVAELGTGGIGAAGLSDVGAVVGATAPERMEALRELMPAAVFLLPGRGRAGRTGRAAVSRVRPGPGGWADRGLAGNRRRLPKERRRSRGGRRRRGRQAARARVESGGLSR